MIFHFKRKIIAFGRYRKYRRSHSILFRETKKHKNRNKNSIKYKISQHIGVGVDANIEFEINIRMELSCNKLDDILFIYEIWILARFEGTYRYQTILIFMRAIHSFTAIIRQTKKYMYVYTKLRSLHNTKWIVTTFLLWLGLTNSRYTLAHNSCCRAEIRHVIIIWSV